MSQFIIKYRVALIIFLVLLTLPFWINLPRLTTDASLSSLIPKSHPASLFSEKMEEMFGAFDQVVIGVSSEKGIYTKDSINAIRELTEFCEKLDEIDEDDVISLTNIDDMRSSNGELIIEPMIDEDALEELDEAAIEKLRNNVRGNPLFRGKLVSEDERSAVVMAAVLFEFSMKEEVLDFLKKNFLQKIAELEKRYPDIKFSFSGPAMLKACLQILLI